MFIPPLSLKIFVMLQKRCWVPRLSLLQRGSRRWRLSGAASGSLCCRVLRVAREPCRSKMNPLACLLQDQDFFHLKTQSKQQGCSTEQTRGSADVTLSHPVLA